MRLVDIEKLDELYVRKKAEAGYEARQVMDGGEVARLLLQAVDALPEVDAVPVIRCMNCAYFNGIEHECDGGVWVTKPEFFCAGGKDLFKDAEQS